jgi:TldD protein
MQLTRRGFLAGTAVAAAGLAARDRLAAARGLLVDATLEEVVGRALAAAKAAGASYADVRLHRRRIESITTREDHVVGTSDSDRYGVGVRVIAGGAWGYAASSRVDGKTAEGTARRAVELARAHARLRRAPVALAPAKAVVDVWQTPLEKDPFKIPLEDKAELLLAINAEVLKVPGVKFVSSGYQGVGEWKLFASSEGSFIEQSQTRVNPSYTATAVDATRGEFETRSHEIEGVQAGWEHVVEAPLLADARRIGEDAVAKLGAPSVKPGARDLILTPSNLWLTIHESIGHATELDRILGYEANLAGTSFLSIADLGKLRYGSPVVNVYADKTDLPGLATVGYDDDGVKTQKWDLIREGLLVGLQSTREQAAWIGEKESRGTCYAMDFASFPFQRMPNISLAAGAKDLGVADLVAATDDGVLVTGRGSWSIDHQRKNFQFGGQMFYEVKKGKIVGPLRDVAYQAFTLDFWRGCDLVGGRREWRMGGSFGDGKGEPTQSQAVSHGCPPARFRAVNILNTSRRDA